MFSIGTAHVILLLCYMCTYIKQHKTVISSRMLAQLDYLMLVDVELYYTALHLKPCRGPTGTIKLSREDMEH